MNSELGNELAAKGVSNPGEFAHLPDLTVRDALAWYSRQHGRVGPGVLVAELRKAKSRRPRWHDNYAENLVAWLESTGLPIHPAAIVELIHLDYRFGRDRVPEHGPAIRAAVTRWEQADG